MRMLTIEITNYKAFLGKHKIEVGGRTVFPWFEHARGFLEQKADSERRI